MIGHLGNRVSALLDGQLSAKDTEEAWAHVYACHTCRDLVEREGWIKTRLAGLGAGERGAPADLKGSLLSMPPSDMFGGDRVTMHGPRRTTSAAMIGGGAIGAAMLGVLAFGLGPGSAPPVDRRPPVTQINNTTVPNVPQAPTPTPVTSVSRGPAAPATNVPIQVRRILP